MRLAQKVIIITGGASGIGLASCEACLQAGAKVVLADLPGSAGPTEAERLHQQHPDQVLFIPVDVTDTASVDELISKTVNHFGQIDSIFSNAGIGGVRPIEETSDEDFQRVIEVNLTGVFRVARAGLRQMYQQGFGNIINCASILGKFGQSQTSAYTAAKAGVINMTRTLAIEAAPKGIRINGIGPGYIKTPLLDQLDDEMLTALIALHPLNRLGRSEEVAAAVVFLASDEASFITGETLMVDGGFTAGKS